MTASLSDVYSWRLGQMTNQLPIIYLINITYLLLFRFIFELITNHFTVTLKVICSQLSFMSLQCLRSNAKLILLLTRNRINYNIISLIINLYLIIAQHTCVNAVIM